MEDHRNYIDITAYSFEEFVCFLFEHEITAGDSWYFNLEVVFDPAEIARHYVKLFRVPKFLRVTYTSPELEQGFWAAQSCANDCSVSQLLRYDGLPFYAKEECVRSMYDLFAQLFAYEPLDSAVYMWWDSLCYDWHCGNRMGKSGREEKEYDGRFFELMSRSGNRPEFWERYQLRDAGNQKQREEEDLRLQEVMFQTLSRVLTLPQEHCQRAALHDLGHLHHPETPRLIGEFISSHLVLSEQLQEYALAAARFKVL
jgi:hypothetical protein